jgi:uncharacterized protein YigE (DUF2233 family)
MTIRSTYTLLLLLCILAAAPIACNSCNVLPTVTKNGTPVVSDSPVSTGTTSAPPLNTWLQATSGVELRYEHWKSPGPDEDTIAIVRFDLQRVHIKIGYQPAQPMGISDWMQQEQALAVINGGYFDQQHKTTSLVVSDGQASGTSYNGFGGMLSVDTQGNVSLRSLRNHPYDPNTEQLQQAMQSSPMLIIDGKRTQFNTDASTQRRSIVAIDTQGRLLLLATMNDGFALDDMADLLASSDLSLQQALNLDGGASTGLYMKAGKQQVMVDAIAALPIVIIVK